MSDFEEPLCGCLSDLMPCCLICCCPCTAWYFSAYSVDKATGRGMIAPSLMPFLFGLIGFCAVGYAINRGKIRKRYNLSGNFIIDVLLHTCCTLCATTQEYREVRKRELNK